MRKENPMSAFRFSLIFEKQFRFWLRKYMTKRGDSEVEKSNHAIVALGAYGIKLWPEFGKQFKN